MADKAVVTQTTLDAIGQAIIAKGGATEPMTPAQMPAAIAAIPSGDDGKWTPPEDWPDIYGILKADTRDYTGKCIVLYVNTKKGEVKSLSGAQAYLTSDGDFYTSNANHTWHDDGYNGYRWVMFYTNDKFGNIAPYEQFSTPITKAIVSNETAVFNTSFTCYFHFMQELLDVRGNEGVINTRDGLYKKISCDWPQGSDWGNNIAQYHTLLTDLTIFGNQPIMNCDRAFSQNFKLGRIDHIPPISSCTNCSYMFYDCYSLTAVPDVLDLSSCTNCSNMFYDCNSLTAVPDVLDLSSCTNCSDMFGRCYSLTAVPDVLDLSSCTNCSYMFGQCNSLTAVPDVLDLSSCTNCSNMFYDCFSLTAVPTHVTAIRGLSFEHSRIISKDSVATFDAGGSVVGGFVGNLNTKPSDAGNQTMEFSSNTKSLFTTSEWTAVKSCLTDKGWAVAPA